MAKKDFTQVNTNPVYNAIAEATADPDERQQDAPARKERRTYSPEEAAEIMQTLNTAGRKGLKLPRINMAFTPDLHEYITTMSRARGETLTEFVNKIVREHMDAHKDLYEKAIEFRNLF